MSNTSQTPKEETLDTDSQNRWRKRNRRAIDNESTYYSPFAKPWKQFQMNESQYYNTLPESRETLVSPQAEEARIAAEELAAYSRVKASIARDSKPKFGHEPPSELQEQARPWFQPFYEHQLVFNQSPGVSESRAQPRRRTDRFLDSEHSLRRPQASDTREGSGSETIKMSQLYIFAVSYAIYDKLQPALVKTGMEWRASPELYNRLSTLFKIFCIQYGYNETSEFQDTKDRIVSFLYENHGQVVEYLGSIALYATRQETDKGLDRNNTMPAAMRMWSQQPWDFAQIAMEAEWSLRLKSQDGTVPTPDIALETFYKLIIQTADFSYLCRGMAGAALLQWGSSAIMHDVGSKILDKLRPRNNRAGDMREQCCVRFCMPTEFFHLHLRSSAHTAQTESKPEHVSLGDMFIITISGDEAQGTTVSNYFKQTWPGHDSLIPAIDEQIINHFMVKTSHKYEPPFDTSHVFELTTSLDDDHLIIEASGDVRLVVEYGEKLCWLASSLRSEFATDPIISESSLSEPSTRATGLSRVQEPWVVFKIKTRSFPLLPNDSTSWLSGFITKPAPLTIVRGFPVARRPELFPGLELHSNDLLASFQNRSDGYIMENYCSFLLRPDWPYLELLGRVDGWMLWHHAHTTNTDKLCQTKSLYAERLEKHPSTLGDLRKHRNLICGCELLDQGKRKTSSSSPSDTDMSLSSGSNELMPSDSEKDEPPMQHSPGFIFFDRILQKLILGSQTGGLGVTTANNDSSIGIETPQGGSAGLSSSSRPRLDKGKRRQREDDSDSEHGENRRRPPPKKSNPQALVSTGRPRFIACPFWKLNPRKHWECFSKKITNIGYVKQHLTRRHTPSLYCQRCFRLFDNEELHDQHIVSAVCTRNPLQRLEGISQVQSSQLSRKSKGSIETQWYKIWDILFPHQHRPSSIYVFCDQTQDLTLVREFSQRNGLVIIRDQIRSSGLLSRPDVSDAQLEDTLSRALDCMFEHYRLSPETLPVPPSDAGGSNQPSDSGVSLNAPYSPRASQIGDSELELRAQDNILESETPVYEDNNTVNTDDCTEYRIAEDLDSFLNSICCHSGTIPELGNDFPYFDPGNYPIPS